MNDKLTKDMSVGALVADDFNRAKVFDRLGIDYCCHGSETLESACAKQNLNPDDVLASIETTAPEGGRAPEFAEWPLDLLVDYVLKKITATSTSTMRSC